MIRRLIASLALVAAAVTVAPAAAEAASHKPPRPLCGETMSCPFDPSRPWLCGRPSEQYVCPPVVRRQALRPAPRHVWHRCAPVHPHRAYRVGFHR